MNSNFYYLKARLFPSVLTTIPIIVLYHNFILPIYQDELEKTFSALPLVTTGIFSGAIFFLFTQINRLISKEFFQKRHFEDEMNMPTTNMLLHGNTFYEPEIKKTIHAKIENKFGLMLPSHQEEINDEKRSRKLISTMVSQIRNSLRDNAILLQHNFEYGFIRNLIGGSPIALLFSIIDFVISLFKNDYKLISVSVFLFLIYGSILILNKVLIRKYGEYYAKVLFEQFLTL